MKIVLSYYIAVILFSVVNSAEASEIKLGDSFHITGCDNGELMVPIVNMWSKPGGVGAGAMVVGKLSGDGRADQGLKCQGSIVELLERKNINGRTFIKIKSVVNLKTGWITENFIGRKTKKWK